MTTTLRRQTWLRRLLDGTDRMSERRFAVLSFVPGGLLLFIFVIPPILAVLVMSFMRIELLRDGPTRFVGLANYLTRLPNDTDFLASIPRTVFLGVGTAVLTVPLALACALLMNRKFKFSAPIGMMILMPWAVAPVVTGVYWKFIFNSQYGLATAAVNAIGTAHGPVNWLDSSTTAMLIAVEATAWRLVPLMALLLLGVLKTIPDSQYKAAEMDGARAWSAFRLITLPALKPTLIVVSVTSTVFALQSIDILFTLTGGGPGQSTTVMSLYLYQSAIGQLSFGYSATLAMVLMAIIAACSSILLMLSFKRRRSMPLESPGSNDQALIRSTGQAIAGLAAAMGSTAIQIKRRQRLPASIGKTAGIAGSVVLVTWLVGPIIWIAIASLQREGAVTSLPLHLSLDFQFSHYTDILRQSVWQHALWVSLRLVIFVTFITLVICSLAAYPLARYRLPGERTIIAGLIGVQMVPAIVLVIPVLVAFRYVNLEDTVTALVLVNVAFWIPLIVWLLRNVFRDVPRSVELAARMDGCSRLETLFRIVIPSARSGISVAAILLLIGTWNEFLFAVTLGNQNAVTVTRTIGFIQSAASPEGPPPVTLVAAAGIIAFLPCMLLVVFFYRKLVSGLSRGYVKN